MSREHAYDSAKAGTFPVPVIRNGNRYVVPTAPLRALLGLDQDQSVERTG